MQTSTDENRALIARAFDAWRDGTGGPSTSSPMMLSGRSLETALPQATISVARPS